MCVVQNDTGVKFNIRVIYKSYFRWAGKIVYKRPITESGSMGHVTSHTLEGPVR